MPNEHKSNKVTVTAGGYQGIQNKIPNPKSDTVRKYRNTRTILGTSETCHLIATICVGSDLFDRNIMKLGIEFTQESAEVRNPLFVRLYRTLGNTLHFTRVDYVLCGHVFYSLSDVESNKSKFCPALPGAWVPANAGIHAEPLPTLLP